MPVEDKVTVENLVDGAIISGFTSGIQSFMESLEESLVQEVTMSKVGGAIPYLSQMLESVQVQKEIRETHDQMADLGSKLAKVLG